MPNHPVNVDGLRTSEYSDLLVVLKHKSGNHQSQYDIILWGLLHGSPSNSSQNMSLKNHKCEPHGGATREVGSSPESVGFHLCGL